MREQSGYVMPIKQLMNMLPNIPNSSEKIKQSSKAFIYLCGDEEDFKGLELNETIAKMSPPIEDKLQISLLKNPWSDRPFTGKPYFPLQ